MGYYSSAFGKIEMDLDVEVEIASETSVEGDCEITRREVVAILPRHYDHTAKYYDVEEHLQLVASAAIAKCPTVVFSGYLERYGENNGDIERYRVVNGKVEATKARVVFDGYDTT